MKKVAVVLLGIVGIAALAVVTVDHWKRPVEHLIWPPRLDENGNPAYQLVSRTAVHPYPDAVAVRLFVETDEPEGEARGGVYIEPSGRSLSAVQRRAFEATLSKVSSRNGAADACFIPHHFLRYYNESGQQVGEIAVCFCCSGAAASPELFSYTGGGFLHSYVNRLDYDREQLKALIESLGLPADVWCRERSNAR